MSEREKKLLEALVLMVRQYLDEEEGVVDSLAMSAGESAIRSLAEYGLMEIQGTGRLGRWTKAAANF